VLLYPDAFHRLVPLAIAVLLFAFVKQCLHPVSIYILAGAELRHSSCPWWWRVVMGFMPFC